MKTIKERILILLIVLYLLGTFVASVFFLYRHFSPHFTLGIEDSYLLFWAPLILIVFLSLQYIVLGSVSPVYLFSRKKIIWVIWIVVAVTYIFAIIPASTMIYRHLTLPNILRIYTDIRNDTYYELTSPTYKTLPKYEKEYLTSVYYCPRERISPPKVLSQDAKNIRDSILHHQKIRGDKMKRFLSDYFGMNNIITDSCGTPLVPTDGNDRKEGKDDNGTWIKIEYLSTSWIKKVYK